MAYVLKVEYEGELRRVVARRAEEGNFSFAEVERRIRDVFQFPSTSELKLTYQDRDGDIVTMASDDDLTDACVIQELNPLRLKVALLPASTSSSAPADLDVEQSLAEIVETLVGLSEPVFRNFFTADQMPELLNHIVERVKDNINALSSSAEPTNPNSGTAIASSRAEQKPEIHLNVTCDVCDMNPIVGPRYKSMKKFNYDLCANCYEKDGNVIEYRRVAQRQPCPGPASSNLGAMRLMQRRNISPAHMMWTTRFGIPASVVCGPRGGLCGKNYGRS